MSIPDPISNYLRIIVDALRKRSKAIKHSVVSFFYSIDLDKVEEENYERFNLDFELAKIHSSIRISFWEDRWVFICVRQILSNGKTFNCKIEGRIGKPEGALIVKKIEETIKISSHSEGSDLDVNLKGIWDKMVLNGPRKIK